MLFNAVHSVIYRLQASNGVKISNVNDLQCCVHPSEMDEVLPCAADCLPTGALSNYRRGATTG
ncbi:hypothetical protein LAZ67_X001750 [Cordylochernes scorpioides]|uniref:Uncharacterized protein n=1 Tax=Cordylochernes scorpioides TaxID=51811 RepID=A0ABY6LVD4_9ARAC|nr:hypothetical protein LAZ67_X001750 [Cordylochernes scorpioides]